MNLRNLTLTTLALLACLAGCAVDTSDTGDEESTAQQSSQLTSSSMVTTPQVNPVTTPPTLVSDNPADPEESMNGDVKPSPDPWMGPKNPSDPIVSPVQVTQSTR